MESGFDELHGIDWNKGCYMGQELTARTKYRGLVKKRLVPITIEGALPAAGTPVMLESKKVGEVRSGRDDRALALMRLEHLGAHRRDLHRRRCCRGPQEARMGRVLSSPL